MFRQLILVLITCMITSICYAHPGRTAADGCHKDNIKGGRHWHFGAGADKQEVPCGQDAPAENDNIPDVAPPPTHYSNFRYFFLSMQ